MSDALEYIHFPERCKPMPEQQLEAYCEPVMQIAAAAEKAGPEGGLKFDAGKAPIWRGFIKYFPRAIEAVANVSKFGFETYKSWGGWVDLPEAFDRYADAEGRHLIGHAKGELNAQDSNLLHLAHKAWNAMAELELHLRATEKEAARKELRQNMEDDWSVRQVPRYDVGCGYVRLAPDGRVIATDADDRRAGERIITVQAHDDLHNEPHGHGEGGL